jgi:hypothetical protein
VGAVHFMRLYLKGAAHTVLSRAAYRIFREMWDGADLALKPSFFTPAIEDYKFIYRTCRFWSGQTSLGQEE